MSKICVGLVAQHGVWEVRCRFNGEYLVTQEVCVIDEILIDIGVP